VIPAQFVLLAAAISLVGCLSYARDTLRGETNPNLVTWSLFALEGLLSFAIERQQHIGWASIMTLMLGVCPLIVCAASLKNPQAVWKLGRFDLLCGGISLLGLVTWPLMSGTVALVAFVAADTMAALPTLRKSWIEPMTESPGAFFAGAVNGFITLLTLKSFTTAGALFPLAITIMDFVIAMVAYTHVGLRWRQGASAQRAE
jgi:hypothetical protein